jgi:hypothetical protein
MPSTSRRPSLLTPTAMVVATETIRPALLYGIGQGGFEQGQVSTALKPLFHQGFWVPY